ncbi:sugar phosphate nucleotidyltransferase [Haloarchaeobius sp. DFWS5]|uniref:sugar phosphate nucleotidyltransferase n=1 Tax=Haloarchaeobius sp. DFWS5 TaxID=3446114 RepID=UPI003EBCCD8D
MKAVILAAGEGRRLEPLTNRRPKPMLPIANKPLLEYVVEAVAEAGIEEIMLVVGYKRERIQTHFGDGADWGVDIEYAVQEKQLGTGHAVLQAEEAIDGGFVVLNGDRIVESTVVSATLDVDRPTDGMTMAVTRSNQPSSYGVVDVDGEFVTALTEKPRATSVPSGIINAGVYRFDESVFDYIRACKRDEGGELGITAVVDRYIADNGVRAVRYRGLWLDISYLWDVPGVSRRVIDRFDTPLSDTATVEESAVVAAATAFGTDVRIGANTTIRPGTTLGDNVTVGANVVLSNVVVYPDVTIGPGTVLRDCVVGENASVGANVTVAGRSASMVVDGIAYDDVSLGAVVGDNAHVGDGVVLESGTVLGDSSLVDTGTTVGGAVDSNVEVRRG